MLWAAIYAGQKEIFPVLRYPGPAEVVGAGKYHQDRQEEEPAPDHQGDHLGRVLHVHKEEDYERCLGTGDGEGNDGIEDPEMMKGCPNRESGQDQQD